MALKQSAETYKKFTVSMCLGMNYIVYMQGFPKYLGYRELITKFLKIVEPLAVKAHKRHHFKRKQYWVAGVNDAWPQDQHDKWKRFGLHFHHSCNTYLGSFN
jgi:hypothetical protein